MREIHKYKGVRYESSNNHETYHSMLDLEEEFSTSSIREMFEAIDNMLSFYEWEHGDRENA